jgi:hypothetical protein
MWPTQENPLSSQFRIITIGLRRLGESTRHRKPMGSLLGFAPRIIGPTRPLENGEKALPARPQRAKAEASFGEIEDRNG